MIGIALVSDVGVEERASRRDAVYYVMVDHFPINFASRRLSLILFNDVGVMPTYLLFNLLIGGWIA